MAFPNGYNYRRIYYVNQGLAEPVGGSPTVAGVIGSDQARFPVCFRNLAGNVSTNGTLVTLSGVAGDLFPLWLPGSEIAINGVPYLVASVTTDTSLHIAPPGAGVQTNVPYYSSAQLRSAANGGHVNSALGLDIIFTDENDNLLPFERVCYDPTTGQHEFWVLRDCAFSGPKTEMRMYYGGPATDLSNKTAVWVDYIGVFHFGRPTDVTLDLSDSTGNGNDGVNNGVSPSPGFLGRFGGGASFPGHHSPDTFITVGNATPPGLQIPAGGFTVQAAILWSSYNSQDADFYNNQGATPGGIDWRAITYNNYAYFSLQDSANRISEMTAGNMIGPYFFLPYIGWGMFFGTAAGSNASDMALYNSSENGDPTNHWGFHGTVQSNALDIGPGEPLAKVGMYITSADNPGTFLGIMDELRFRSGAASGDRIATEVNTLAWQPVFFTVQNEEAGTSGGIDFSFGLNAANHMAIAGPGVAFEFGLNAVSHTASGGVAFGFSVGGTQPPPIAAWPPGGYTGLPPGGGIPSSPPSASTPSPTPARIKTQVVCPPLNPYDKCLNEEMATARAVTPAKPRCHVPRPTRRRSYPRVDMPARAVSVNKQGSIPPPAPASGYVPVVSLFVPQGYAGVITALYQTFTGALTQGSGDLEWALQIGRWFVKRLANVTLTMGTAKNPFPLNGGYPLIPNQKVTLYVRNNNAAAIPPGVGLVNCGIKGWTYPLE